VCCMTKPLSGNVRELGKRSSSGNDSMHLWSYHPGAHQVRAAVRRPMRSSTPVPILGADAAGSAALGCPLEDIERDAIVKDTREDRRYNKTAAAKLLGMSFRALR